MGAMEQDWKRLPILQSDSKKRPPGGRSARRTGLDWRTLGRFCPPDQAFVKLGRAEFTQVQVPAACGNVRRTR